MSKQVCNRCILLMAVPLLMVGSTAFGWAGTTHSLICKRNFNDPVLQQFLGSIDQNAVENYIGEPDGHSQQWISMTNRSYIDTADPIQGFDWNAMDETTRLQALMHHVGDVSVPAHHAPAVYEYNSQWAEGLCEAAAAVGYTSVGELPNVVGTTSYTHTQNGHTYNFTGTIDQIVDTFEDACRDNAAWYESTKHTIFDYSYHLPSDIADANWNALKIDLMLQRAVFVDYFLAKQNPKALASGADRVVYPGQTVNFDASSSYDPDEIIWDSDGTYHNIGTSLDADMVYMWDFNNDGTWDWIDDDPYVNMTYNQLLALGMPTNEWVDCRFLIMDNEGKCDDDIDALYLASGGAPEPASLSLLAVGGLALLRRRSR